MSKNRKPKTRTPRELNHDALSSAAGRDYVSAMREGRRNRAATFKDRKRESSRKACRGYRG